MIDRMGRSRLHYAAAANDLRLVRSELDGGADPNAADSDGFRPLHFAAQQSAAEAAELLLNAGAEVDATNRHGNTPLFVAVFNSKGDGAAIRLLRVHGADPSAVNAAGQSPVGLARVIANYPVAQFFADFD